MLSRRDSVLLRAFALWTVWVWGTRIWNVIGDDGRGTAFKVVHMLLALVSVAFAVATWVVVSRRRRGVAAGPEAPAAPRERTPAR